MKTEYDQNAGREFVDRHVLWDVGEVITRLAQSEEYWDGVHEAFTNYNYTECLSDWFTTGDIVDINDALEDEDIEDTLASRRQAWERFKNDHDLDDRQEFCHEHDIDFEDYAIEVYEYWLVDSYLEYQLTQRGEMVADIAGLKVWGRTTTGQAIMMDHVIQDIVQARS